MYGIEHEPAYETLLERVGPAAPSAPAARMAPEPVALCYCRPVDRRHATGIALVVASACGYGSGPLFAKGVYGSGIDWLGLLAWRFLIGAILAWIFVLARPRDRLALRSLDRRHVIALLALGAFFVGNAGTYYASLETVSASLAALIVYIYPALVAVLSIRFGHGLHGRRPWAALAIVMFGAALTIGGIEGRVNEVGLGLAFASPLLYSVYIIVSARLAGERRGATAAGRSRNGAAAEIPTSVAAAVMLTATWAVVAAMAAVAEEPLLPWQVPSQAWVGLVGIAVLSTFVAIEGFYAGTARIGAANAALVSTVEPVYTITLATLLFGEHLGPIQLVGGALVIGGVIVAQTTPGAVVEAVVEEA